MDKIDIAKRYYLMAARLRNIAAAFEDEGRREVKDNYERAVQERLARRQEATDRHRMGDDSWGAPVPVLWETSECVS